MRRPNQWTLADHSLHLAEPDVRPQPLINGQCSPNGTYGGLYQRSQMLTHMSCLMPASTPQNANQIKDVHDWTSSRGVGRAQRVLVLVRLDVSGPDHLAPLFGVVGDELAEVGYQKSLNRSGAITSARRRGTRQPSLGSNRDFPGARVRGCPPWQASSLTPPSALRARHASAAGLAKPSTGFQRESG
jgi:hypothetical protein